MLPSSITRSLLAVASLVLPAFAQSTSQACNNSPALCSQPYNNITNLGAHNSPFLRNQDTTFSTSGNQYYSSTVQLSAGVRLLTAQVHRENGELHLCHTTCVLLDAGRLRTWLTEIRTWMDANPNEVVTLLLVNSDNVSAADLAAEYTASGITQYVYTPTAPVGTISWPTLSQMISNNNRLVTFVASLASNTGAPYLLDQFTYVFENSFENSSPSDFSCQPSRPTNLKNLPAEAINSGRMFLQNHFLYDTQAFGIETPDTANLESTNSVQNGSAPLGRAITTCTQLYGRRPSFVTVDFFNVGPAIASVDLSNGVQSPVGRKTVSTAQLSETTSAGVKTGVESRSLGAAVVGLLALTFLF